MVTFLNHEIHLQNYRCTCFHHVECALYRVVFPPRLGGCAMPCVFLFQVDIVQYIKFTIVHQNDNTLENDMFVIADLTVVRLTT